MELKNIKEHIADQIADKATVEIMKWNNGQTLYEHEVEEFVELFRKVLLIKNGYN